jgi:hypothetical protein
MLTQKQKQCFDCLKPICSHCCVEIPNSPAKKYTVWRVFLTPEALFLSRFRSFCLCHVCSEIRDIWKKTGAWFYKGLPNYEIPSRPSSEEKSEEQVVRNHEFPWSVPVLKTENLSAKSSDFYCHSSTVLKAKSHVSVFNNTVVADLSVD